MRGASNFEGLGEGIYAGVSPPSENNCLGHNARAPDEDQKGDPDQNPGGGSKLAHINVSIHPEAQDAEKSGHAWLGFSQLPSLSKCKKMKGVKEVSSGFLSRNWHPPALKQPQNRDQVFCTQLWILRLLELIPNRQQRKIHGIPHIP